MLLAFELKHRRRCRTEIGFERFLRLLNSILSSSIISYKSDLEDHQGGEKGGEVLLYRTFLWTTALYVLGCLLGSLESTYPNVVNAITVEGTATYV
jgi:hypothetical protein